jgi:hypothetical protein
MGYIRRDGAKEAHVWQLSAYWYALRNMGLPLVKTLHVYYLPMSPLGGTEVLLPELIECDVLPEDLVIERMVNRARETKLYLDAVADAREAGIQGNAVFVNEYLAPPMERKQALRWDKAKGIFIIVTNAGVAAAAVVAGRRQHLWCISLLVEYQAGGGAGAVAPQAAKALPRLR